MSAKDLPAYNDTALVAVTIRLHWHPWQFLNHVLINKRPMHHQRQILNSQLNWTNLAMLHSSLPSLLPAVSLPLPYAMFSSRFIVMRVTKLTGLWNWIALPSNAQPPSFLLRSASATFLGTLIVFCHHCREIVQHLTSYECYALHSGWCLLPYRRQLLNCP